MSTPTGSATGKAARSLPAKVVDFLASYAFAIILLCFLLLLTFLGTLAQASSSLFEVQERYFASYFLVDWTLGFPLPLPGVYLLLGLLAVNLALGGFIRIRKSAATFGVIIVHVGIVVMLLGGLIEYHASTKGHMTLYEGEASDEYQSYFEWELAVGEANGLSEYVIPGEQFETLDPDAAAKFQSPTLPFDITVGMVFDNCEPMPAGRRREDPPGAAPARKDDFLDKRDPQVVNGFFLRRLPLTTSAESHVLGMYAKITETASGRAHHAILWGYPPRRPYSLIVDGRQWDFRLQRRRWPVPFEIKLKDFRKEDHARERKAKSFESDVFKVDGGQEQLLTISMNNPLRDQGFTFFQSSWGPSNARPGDPLFSTFSVVQNPADDLPLISCYIIALGLVMHFSRKLYLHVRKQSRKVNA